MQPGIFRQEALDRLSSPEQLDQVRPHRLVEIEQFFPTYKTLEDKAVEVIGWSDREKALQVLRDDRRTWQRELEARAPEP